MYICLQEIEGTKYWQVLHAEMLRFLANYDAFSNWILFVQKWSLVSYLTLRQMQIVIWRRASL